MLHYPTDSTTKYLRIRAEAMDMRRSWSIVNMALKVYIPFVNSMP